MSAKATVARTTEVSEVGGMHFDPPETLRRLWLAGLGAGAMAQDEIERLAKRCVERGEMTEKESRKLIAKAKELPQKSIKSAEGQMDRQVDSVLDWLGILTKNDLERMDLPSRADIESLGEKVAALTRKVEQLRKAEETQTREVAALRKVDEKATPVNN